MPPRPPERSPVHRAFRRAAGVIDPTPFLTRAWPVRETAAANAGTCCLVYRQRNAVRARALVDEAITAGLTPVLWALDATDPLLDRWTVGCGPGTRQALLNRLVADSRDDGWTVLADDDVTMRAGALRRCLEFGAAAGFALLQPAHGRSSHTSTGFVRAEPFTWARETTFVEVGPVAAIAPAARPHLLPLDESLGMGWGQDYLWARAAADAGLRLAIVDGIRMRHVGSDVSYDRADAWATLRSAAARSGFASLRDVYRERARWWLWERPPWSQPGVASELP